MDYRYFNFSPLCMSLNKRLLCQLSIILVITLLIGGCGPFQKLKSQFSAQQRQNVESDTQDAEYVDEEGFVDPSGHGVFIADARAYDALGLDTLDMQISHTGLEPFPEITEEEITLTPEEEKEICDSANTVAYDIPIVVNKKVEQFIKYYTQKRTTTVTKAMSRSGKYLDMIDKKLEECALPRDLKYLCLIESAWKEKITSRAQARGLWQFIRGTGRRYDLRIDWWVDERCDPEKETDAACKYLSFLYDRYHDWYLALAAYNCGEARVDRAIKRTGKKDFWELCKYRYYIPRETRNYVPAFIAAVIISKNPEEYGLFPEYEDPVVYDVVKVTKPASLDVLAKCAGTTTETLIDLNPELRRWCTPTNQKNYKLKVPANTETQFYAKYSQLKPEELVTWRRHVVGRGETLGLISRRYGTSITAVAQANRIHNVHRLSIGQVLLIPSGPGNFSASHRYEENHNYSSRSHSSGHEKIYHVVRRGETLGTIAQRYRVSLSRLKSWNRIGRYIYPGQKLAVYVPKRHANSNPVKIASGETMYHTVRRGDTMWDIARKYNISVSKLRQLNNVSPRGLRPGDKLLISPGKKSASTTTRKAPPSTKASHPAPGSGNATYHTVARGETLWDISRHYNVSISDLQRLNRVSPRRMKPGDVLVISVGNSSANKEPSSSTVSEASSPTSSQSNAPSQMRHTVRKGDTLWDISRKYNVSVHDLQRWNSVSPRSMKPGDQLVIFGK